MRFLFLLALALAASGSIEDLWLQRVEVVMSREDRELYRSLANEKAREVFRQGFWSTKAVTEAEYFERVTYIDEAFGSGKAGSGANTDPGRLYLALGPPTAIQRLPSSRVFYPNEIWYYDHAPGLPSRSRLQFLFFRPRDLGVMKLYSPQVHTLRALIINNAGTRGMFPANDIIREQDVLNSLNLSPAEIDVLDAAMSVSKGIKASGNSELLYLASSPREMLSRQRLGLATSRIRFDLERPKFSYEQTVTASRIPAVDVRFTGTARGLLGLEVQGGDTYSSRLGFEQSQPFVYSQRLYLLPGEYTLFLDVDGFRTGYSLRVDKVDTLQKQAVNVADGDDWTAIGKQYLKTGDAARAGACFAKALKLRRSPEALLGAARVAFARQQLDAARDLLWEALSLRPDHFEALVTLAGVTAEFQDYPLARQMYERAVAIRDHPALRQALQQLPR